MHYILGTYLYITTYLTVLHDRLKCLLSYKQITLVPYMGTDGNYLYHDFSTISLTTFRIIRRIRLACTTSYIPLQYYISYSAPWLIEVLTLIFTLKSCPISSKMSSSNRTCLFQECKWDTATLLSFYVWKKWWICRKRNREEKTVIWQPKMKCAATFERNPNTIL